MFIADAHCDTLYALALEGKRIEHCALAPQNFPNSAGYLQTYALFAGMQGPLGTPYENGLKMLESIPRLGVPVLTEALPDAPPDTACGVISMEGGEMLLGSIEKLHEFHRRARVRMIALTWNHENEIAFPGKSGSNQPLKPFGRELLSEMDRLGILADVSHLNDAGFYDTLKRAKLPPVASHSNLRTICNVSRNLTPDMVKALVEAGGFIGINFYSAFLKTDGNATRDDVLRHIDAISELGGVGILGLGSDFDGIEAWPDGLASPHDVPALLKLLEDHGYTQQQLEGIAGMNLWRVLKRAEAATNQK